MRYLDNVIFVEETEERYDPELGEYVGGNPIEKTLLVNVTDLGSERSVALFGDVMEQSKTIRFQPLQELPEFDYVVIDDKTYKIVKPIHPRDRQTLIVKEFTHGEG